MGRAPVTYMVSERIIDPSRNCPFWEDILISAVCGHAADDPVGRSDVVK
jgi:hypothetical protein